MSSSHTFHISYLIIALLKPLSRIRPILIEIPSSFLWILVVMETERLHLSQIRSNQVDCLFVSLQSSSLPLCSMKATASVYHSLVHSVRHKPELMDIVEINSIGAFILLLDLDLVLSSL